MATTLIPGPVSGASIPRGRLTAPRVSAELAMIAITGVPVPVVRNVHLVDLRTHEDSRVTIPCDFNH